MFQLSRSWRSYSRLCLVCVRSCLLCMLKLVWGKEGESLSEGKDQKRDKYNNKFPLSSSLSSPFLTNTSGTDMVPNRPSFSASCLCTTFYHRSLLPLPRKKSLSVVGKRDRVAAQMEVKKRRTEIEGEEERVMVGKTGTLRLVHTPTSVSCFASTSATPTLFSSSFSFHLFLRSEPMGRPPIEEHAASWQQMLS